MSTLMADSSRFAALQSGYVAQQAKLWAATLAGTGADVVGERGDKRFAGKEWRDNAYYSYLRQSYLLAANFLNDLAASAQLDEPSKERLQFAVRQWCDAMAPTNFAATNPAVLREAIDTGGESLTRGLANLIADTQRGRILQTDESKFEVGGNLALARGDVVFENELIQLIQYQPTTAEVGARPLVMVPPCINKFYILDLRPENSFVRYAVAQGHTVFMVSWRNVGPAQGHFDWDAYVDAVLKALEVGKEITGSDRVNALGFCVGGTLLASALAVLAGKGEQSVESTTYLATMLDFEEAGQIRLFVDEKGVASREEAIGKGGILPGADLAATFNALRANDLVWPYVVGNYLMGGAPAAFDLLYWNADSTNLPGPMYCSYVRNTYLENRLREPGAVRAHGVPIDLGKVDRPAFILATREDHIVPWRAAYRSVPLLGGKKTFVLGASGHIAGVINPPEGNKRSHWLSDALPEVLPEDAEAWFGQAREERGSWWPRWSQWLEQYQGGKRASPAQTGSTQYPAIEPAPGRYVKQKASLT
jgi:polyhydroxyalkanoate synthase